MGDNKENAIEDKRNVDLKNAYEADGVLGSSADPASVTLSRTNSLKKKRKVKSAKSSTTDNNPGSGIRRAASARSSRKGPKTRNITSQYSQKKLNSKRKRSSNVTASGATDEDANKYKNDFDDAIAKLTNPNLLTKAKANDVTETSSSNSGVSAESLRKAGVVRRVRSAQSVVGPRPHLSSGHGARSSDPPGEGTNSATRPGLSKQTLSVDTCPIPVFVRDQGIGISKPFNDKPRPSTASSSIGSRTAAGGGTDQQKPTVTVRPQSSLNRPLPNTSMIQSRLRTYFSGAPGAGTRSMVATTLKSGTTASAAAAGSGGGSSDASSGAAAAAGSKVEPAGVVNGVGSNTGNQSNSTNSSSSTPQTGGIKLRTTTSTIQLKPINGLNLISASRESLASNTAVNSMYGYRAGNASNTANSSSLSPSTAKVTPAPSMPKPILKKADVVKQKTKRNVRFSLPDDDSDN